MRRCVLSIPLLVACVWLAACGGGSSKVSAPTSTKSSTTTLPAFLCEHKTPGQAGECIKQELRFKHHLSATSPFTSSGPQQGVDISNWQGIPDWGQAKREGIKFAIVQTNDGGFRNPFFGLQVAGLRGAGLPWGVYTFVEAYSGSAQAAVASSMGVGAPLGAWADTEVPGSYGQACSYVNYARTHGFKIVGVYSSPGIYEGGRCQGYDWPAEWSGGRAYPLPGYSSSVTVVRQWCGTCHMGGFSGEVDRDESLGLLTIAFPPKPVPPPTPRPVLVRRLRHDEALHHHYHVLIVRHRCVIDRRHHSHHVPHTHGQYVLCFGHNGRSGWVEEGHDAIDDIDVLHAHGIR
jgi:hypothetical protein